MNYCAVLLSCAAYSFLFHARYMKNSSVKFENNGFISLNEAANLCSYTQEYLSLLARRGHLKAQKIGRNWFTKKDWLREYINLHPAESKGNVKGLMVEDQRYLKSLPGDFKSLAFRRRLQY